MKSLTKITDVQYGGLTDTLNELCQAGIISSEELDAVMLDLLLSTAIDFLELKWGTNKNG